MTKFFSFLFLTIFLFTTVSAQDENKKVNVGFQFTPEISWMKAKSKEISNAKTKIGFSFGPVFNINFDDNYAISTGLNINRSNAELLYSVPTKINSQGDTIFASGTRIAYKLQYVEIPLILRFQTNEIGYMKYYFQFGIVPAVNISAKGNIIGIDNKGINDEDLNPDVSLPNLSMFVGAGLSYSLTNSTSVFGTFGFSNGLIDVTDNPEDYKTKAILNRLGLSVGIMF